jgi:hypothetical protein
VSASSLRFHPECFRCDHCHTRLEHVGFFPEPEESRRKRIEVHQDDRSSMSSSSASGIGKVRFYCHLDFHELYSPRCRSCKTPIEGEVVVACGGAWHVGHFFCAECGDVRCTISRTSQSIANESLFSAIQFAVQVYRKGWVRLVCPLLPK